VYSDLKDGRRGRNDVGIIPNKCRIPELCQGKRAWEAYALVKPMATNTLPTRHHWNPERAQNNSHE